MSSRQALKVGVLGLRRGMTFATQFNTLPETRTVAVCDQDSARIEHALNTLGSDARGFSEYNEMLATDLDIVVVASGAPDHVLHCCQALESGRHVLSEVPADISLDRCRELVASVRKTGRKYMLAENCCYWGFVQEYRRQVRTGRLGDVLYAEGEYLHDVRRLYLENLDLPKDAGFRALREHPKSRRTWRADLHPINYLTHDLGPLLEILDDRCVSVCAMATASACGEGFAPAAEVALFKTAGGRVIKLLTEFSLPRPSHHWFALMGTKGSLESPRGPATKHLLYCEDENMESWSEMAWSTRLLAGPAAAWKSGHGGADWHISREFADCILHDTPSPIDVFRAMDYTVPGICAVRSIEQGGAPVPIPDLRED
ncbi:MAG: Gfo/Idh/MocA family oxidoreductase [Kiritimatiellaeota bacterium]|nr:Gfo/Idh/MocA family oxidoreductase [Kiritimatiellota bacterium]